MSFAFPYGFLLLLPLALAAWRMLRRGRRGGVRFAPVKRLPAKTAGWRAKLAGLAPYVFVAGACALAVACARPRRPLNRANKSINAIAIAMTVDVSGSMEALDLSPEFAGGANLRNVKIGDLKTRLDVVKELFARFVEARPDDLIGLVTFGGYAASRAPLTADHEALVKTLKGVEVPSLTYDTNGQPVDAEETMTAIGDGLMTALSRLKGAEVKSKIVILLSDGMSNTGAVDPDDAAKAAAKMGIKVYTIGVGTHGSRTPFRSRDVFGRTSIAYANMSFDESQLKSIAGTTGARYFAVNDAEGLKAALDEIDMLEKTVIDRTVFQRYHEYFPPFLLAGALLVFLSVSLQMAASRRLA